MGEADSLEAPVEVGRCPRHYGLDEEGLLAPTLLVAPHDAEAPALAIGLHQDNVTAPVHVTSMEKIDSVLPDRQFNSSFTTVAKLS